MTAPSWMTAATACLGLRETAGPSHTPAIVGWWRSIGSAIRDDETPWCAAFVGGILEGAGIRSSRSAAARSYLKWGTALASPAVGAVVVFWRGKPAGWSGHVGFIAGRDTRGRLVVLGGNQGDAVSLAPFDLSRVLGYRWPAGQTPPQSYGLPTIDMKAASSVDEA